MRGLHKPHRVAFLVPEITVDGLDVSHEREAALLVWITCIELCQRHPGLSVYDAESMPIAPRDGHFVPMYATRGATPGDAFFGPTRREELVWLELTLISGKSGAVRLHAVTRDGAHQSFDSVGRKLGDQIDQVLTAWLAGRDLGPLPKRFEPVTVDEVLATVRMIAPSLIERARVASPPPATLPWSLRMAGEEDREGDEVPAAERDRQASADDDIGSDTQTGGKLDDAGDEGVLHASMHGIPDVTHEIRPVSRAARALAQRLPATLKLPALRLLVLALHENLDDLILAIDPDHPQALFARFLAAEGKVKDVALLRRVIAAAPGWARPYAQLVTDGAPGPNAPSALESVSGAGMAAMCRPGHLDVLDAASHELDDRGRIDEGIRLMERAVDLHDEPRAHITLMNLQRSSERVGTQLAHALRAGQRHGCPMESFWYPDQILIDMWVSEALLNVGRLDEAIALRANRLEGREVTWPRYTRLLGNWRKNPKFVAWCYAREGYFRGDDARAVEGFGRVEPGDSVDLAVFLDSLVALGRESEVPLAWAQFGLGRGFTAPIARLAAARGLMAAGEWRRGMEQLWRVEFTEPGRDEHVAISRCGLLMSSAPIDVAETALGDRVAIGAPTLARRMARDIADFMPAAATSGLVARALGGRSSGLEFDPAWLAGFAPETRSRRAIDALFAEHGALRGGDDQLARGDRLINRWLEVAFEEASEANPASLVQAAAYTAAQALARYLAATTAAPSAVAGALRTVASEALELVRRHRRALGDCDVRAVLASIEPTLRRVDRWVGSTWLATVERCCGIDERTNGAVASFVREQATVAARLLGPEEAAVLSASVARLHRERPEGWASAVGTQAERLALHTGSAGLDEWADAIVAQLAERAIDVDDAIDGLHTACYLAEGVSATPCLHAARTLLRAGRAPAALTVLSSGLAAADVAQRDREIATLGDDWKRSGLDVPLQFDKVASGMFEALQKGELARAEKLGRFAVAFDPTNSEAHRNLGLALARQGKVADALHHLARGTSEQASQILAGVLYQSGKLPEAMAVLDHASRWYVRADQWLTYGGIAYAATDNPRTAKAYGFAHRLDPAAFDASQLNAYAGVLDEVGDYKKCELVAKQLLVAARDDLMWQTCAWNHEACALIGQGHFTRALELAERAVGANPLADNTAAFATTLERAKTRSKTTPPPPADLAPTLFTLLEAGDHGKAASALSDPSWRNRRAALSAIRFRFASENQVAVTSRARTAAIAMLADTIGLVDGDAVLCRVTALQIREQAYFARDPVPPLGDRMTRDAFYKEFRARGGVVLGDEAPAPTTFVDRVVVPGAKVSRVSDYIALLRDLAALTPREALAQFDLDAAGYIEVSKAWGAAMDADPTIAMTIAAGLSRGRS